jgi:hypothetical protein
MRLAENAVMDRALLLVGWRICVGRAALLFFAGPYVEMGD